jgi:hypothetical protein
MLSDWVLCFCSFACFLVHFAFSNLFHFTLNAIAGVVWAGAQPRDENALDPEFLRRLDAILNLTDANGIAVLFATWRIYVSRPRALSNHSYFVRPFLCR